MIYWGYGDAASRDAERRGCFCLLPGIPENLPKSPPCSSWPEWISASVLYQLKTHQPKLLGIAFIICFMICTFILRHMHVATILSQWYFQLSLQGMFTGRGCADQLTFRSCRLSSNIWNRLWQTCYFYLDYIAHMPFLHLSADADQFICKMNDCSVKTLAKSFVKQKRDYFNYLWKIKNEEDDKQIFHFIKICHLLLPCISLELSTCASQKSKSFK